MKKILTHAAAVLFALSCGLMVYATLFVLQYALFQLAFWRGGSIARWPVLLTLGAGWWLARRLENVRNFHLACVRMGGLLFLLAAGTVGRLILFPSQPRSGDDMSNLTYFCIACYFAVPSLLAVVAGTMMLAAGKGKRMGVE